MAVNIGKGIKTTNKNTEAATVPPMEAVAS